MEDFIKYFKEFKKEAFRLEILQRYNVRDEKESFEKFMKNKKVSLKKHKIWLSIIDDAKKRGAKINRVRIIKNPLSDYIRYEMEMFKSNVKHGEDILFIEDKYYRKFTPQLKKDFWLFDDKIVLEMNYDKNGRFLGFTAKKKGINKYIRFKDKMLNL